MLIILLPLACFPLLGLESMRWHHHHGQHRLLRKAFWLAWTSSVLWSLLGDYVSTAYPSWSWLFYLLLAAGASYTGFCAWKLYEKSQRQRCTIRTILAYVLVFNLIAWLMPDTGWIMLQEKVAATGSLSHWRGPLH